MLHNFGNCTTNDDLIFNKLLNFNKLKTHKMKLILYLKYNLYYKIIVKFNNVKRVKFFLFKLSKEIKKRFKKYFIYFVFTF